MTGSALLHSLRAMVSSAGRVDSSFNGSMSPLEARRHKDANVAWVASSATDHEGLSGGKQKLYTAVLWRRNSSRKASSSARAQPVPKLCVGVPAAGGANVHLHHLAYSAAHRRLPGSSGVTLPASTRVWSPLNGVRFRLSLNVGAVIRQAIATLPSWPSGSRKLIAPPRTASCRGDDLRGMKLRMIDEPPVVLVVMGVAGTGKSKVAATLAERLGWDSGGVTICTSSRQRGEDGQWTATDR